MANYLFMGMTVLSQRQASGHLPSKKRFLTENLQMTCIFIQIIGLYWFVPKRCHHICSDPFNRFGTIYTHSLSHSWQAVGWVLHLLLVLGAPGLNPMPRDFAGYYRPFCLTSSSRKGWVEITAGKRHLCVCFQLSLDGLVMIRDICRCNAVQIPQERFATGRTHFDGLVQERRNAIHTCFMNLVITVPVDVTNEYVRPSADNAA